MDVNINEAMIDHHKYEVLCSRCGKPIWTMLETLDILPIICSDNCHINMPVRFSETGKQIIFIVSEENSVC